uniref:HUN domain-containing protein n=2 Tax=Caenorhabditis tropicalis TaxID=1561998 RepID=A0A1I7UI28_9PELO
MLTVVITIMFQNMIQVLNRVKKEKDEENKKKEVKKEDVKVEEVIEKPIGPVINAQKEFIEKKKSIEKEWEPETRYRNQGTVFIKSQNVSAADLGVGLDEQEKEAEAKKKKRGGGGISKVKWSDDPIVFYEIGDDFDRFEVDATGGTFSSSSVMTASIKKL